MLEEALRVQVLTNLQAPHYMTKEHCLFLNVYNILLIVSLFFNVYNVPLVISLYLNVYNVLQVISVFLNVYNVLWVISLYLNGIILCGSLISFRQLLLLWQSKVSASETISQPPSELFLICPFTFQRCDVIQNISALPLLSFNDSNLFYTRIYYLNFHVSRRNMLALANEDVFT